MTKKRARSRRRVMHLAPTNDVATIVASKAFEHLTEALGVYLDAVGWKAVVVGTPRIQRPGDAAFNYEFVVKFTGGRKS